MKTTAKWINQFQSVVDNGRTHAMVIDLPASQSGTDSGPTALELAIMGLSGCISTIFAKVAEKMRLTFEALEIEMEAHKPEGARTIEKVHFDMKIKSDATDDKIQKCLDTTVNNCPVGVLFKDAGVEFSSNVVRL